MFEDLRCFNYLSNSVEQRTGIEITGFEIGQISGKTAIRSIPSRHRNCKLEIELGITKIAALTPPAVSYSSSRTTALVQNGVGSRLYLDKIFNALDYI